MSTYDPLLETNGWRRYYFLVKKFLVYLARYSRDPQYLITYLTKAVDNNYCEDVGFLDNDSLLNSSKTRSTIRFGDGEFGMLIDRKNIHFQKADPELILKLREIAETYTDSSPYLLGLNPQISIPNNVLSIANKRFFYLQQKLGFRLYCNKTATYSNASCFYLDGMPKKFLSITSRDKKVIVVTHPENITQLRQRQDEFFPNASSFEYIENPIINAFSVYTETFLKILHTAEDNTVVYTANGPAGKALVYDLSKKHVLAHDIGHGLQFALDGVSREELIDWEMVKSHFANSTAF